MSTLMPARTSLTLSTASGFIPGTLVRQRLGIFRLVFRKIVLKNFRKIVRKVLRVQVVIEFFTQESFKRFKSARSDQTRFQAA